MSAITAPGASLRRVLVALLLAVGLTAVAATNATPASALVPKPVKQVLPKLAGGATKVLKARGELIAGAFLGGFWFGENVVGPAIFGQMPADTGGSYAPLHYPGWSQPGYSFDPTTRLTYPPTRLDYGASTALRVRNTTGLTQRLRADVECVQETAGVVKKHPAVQANGLPGRLPPTDVGTQLNSPNFYLGCSAEFGTGFILHTVSVYNDTSGALLTRWVYEPPALATNTWSVTTRVTCADSSGAVLGVVTTAQTVTAGPGAAVTLQGGNCAGAFAGSHAVGMTVGGGGRGEAQDDVFMEAVPWSAGSASAYPLCTTGAGAGGCELVALVGTSSCWDAGVECGNWAQRPDAVCKWGPYTVPLSWCSQAYEEFLTQPSTLPASDPTAPAVPIPGTPGAGTTLTNPDGSTTTTQTQTLPDGSTRTVTTTINPDGSRTVTTQPTNPDGSPKGVPTVVNVPAPGNPTTPGTNPDPGDGQNCMAGGFSWNPVSWVYTPVKCAMVWAFVPSAATLTSLETAAADAGSRVPLSYLLEAGGFVVGVLGGTGSTVAGCFVYDVELGELGTFHVIDSCADEAIPNAIRPWRPLLTVAVYVSFLGPLAWWAWKSYAPLSRPQG